MTYKIGDKVMARESNKVFGKLGGKVGQIVAFDGDQDEFERINSGDINYVAQNGDEKTKQKVGSFGPVMAPARKIVTVNFQGYSKSMFLDRVHRYYRHAS